MGCAQGGVANIIIGTRRIDTLENPMKYDSLKKDAIIADGKFSQVHLAHNGSLEKFAIKEMKKEALRSNTYVLDQLDAENKTRLKKLHKKGKIPFLSSKLPTKTLLDQVREEVKVLELLSSEEMENSFIPKFFGAFETQNNMYIVTEFIPGGELFRLVHSHVLKDMGNGMYKEDTVFYAGIVALLIDHLHSHNIMHRDIRPENLIVEFDGYIKLIDFGFAKRWNPEEKHNKAFTVCGDPEYMAPEIIIGKGYSKKVDWWAFGILVFELLIGKSPFGDRHGDYLTTCKSVVEDDVNLPSNKHSDVQKLLKRCCNRLVHEDKRRVSFYKIQKEDYFKNLNFEELKQRKIDPPHIPWLDKKIEDIPDDEILEFFPHETRVQKVRVKKKVESTLSTGDDDEEEDEDEEEEEIAEDNAGSFF